MMATPPPSRDGDETVDAVEHERLESLGETRTGREPPTSAREAEPWSYPDRTRIEHMSARTWASASEKSRLKLRKQVGRKPDSQKLRGDKKANELTLVRALPPPQIRGKEKGWQWAVCPPREYICSPLQHEWWAQFGDEWWEIGRARSKHEPYNKHKGCAVDAWDADWAATTAMYSSAFKRHSLQISIFRIRVHSSERSHLHPPRAVVSWHAIILSHSGAVVSGACYIDSNLTSDCQR